MKKLIILFILLSTSVFAQSPPTDISFGVMAVNGGKADYAIQASGVINVMSQRNIADEVYSQVYVQLGGTFADDIYLSDGALKELEALTGYAVIEKFFGRFSFASGVGIMNVQREGDNDYKVPVLFKSTFQLWDFLRVGVQMQYVPIKDEGDLVFAGINIGVRP